jgi:hypothetical protein
VVENDENPIEVPEIPANEASETEKPIQLPPFERAIFEALKLEAHQVRKVDLSIGPRSQTVTLKFALNADQVFQLDAMVGERLP